MRQDDADEALARTRRMLATLRGRDPRSRDVHTLSELETELAQLLVASGRGSSHEVRSALARSAVLGHASVEVMLAYDEGKGTRTVLVEEPDGSVRSFPVAGLAFGFDAWIRTWFAALVAEDDTVLTALARPEVLWASSPPSELSTHDGWASHCKLLSELALKPEPSEWLQAWADHEAGDVDDGAGSQHSAVRLHLGPTDAMARAIAARDGATLVEVLRTALEEHRKYWLAEELDHHPRAVWPPEVVGLARIAAVRGLVPEAELLSVPGFPSAVLARDPLPRPSLRVIDP